MFAYCNNSPVTYADFSGHWASDDITNPNPMSRYDAISGEGGGGVVIVAGGGILFRLGTALVGAVEATASSIYQFGKFLWNKGKDMFENHQPRIHHIIPKGEFEKYGRPYSDMMVYMHAMLEDAGIGINSPYNLTIVSQGSHKSMHTKSYIICIYNIMRTAEGGGRYDVLLALFYARLYVASLDKYANGW